MNPTHCLYHANCLDGFGAALVVWRANPDCQFFPVQYGDPLPEIPDGSKVAIVDFSFPRPVLDELAGRCELIVLDHHKTAEEQLRGAPYAIFDLEKSGCRLAWDYFLPEILVSRNDGRFPIALQLIEDRDLWKFSHPATRAFTAGLSMLEKDFETWEHVVRGGCGRYGLHQETYKSGEIIHGYQCKQAKSQAKKAWIEDWGPHRVVVANVTTLISETNHAMLELHPDCDFSATFFYTEDKAVWSLRSSGDFDVSAIAAKYPGGGGHKNAAGFSMSTPCIFWGESGWHLTAAGRMIIGWMQRIDSMGLQPVGSGR